MRIRDDASSYLLCVREWRRLHQKAEAEPDPEMKVWASWGIETYGANADHELLNLAWRIYFEGNWEEKRRMPHPTTSPKDFVNWARAEARSADPQRRARWECIEGKMSSALPSDSEEVDPWPYLSPYPAMD